MSIDLNYKPFDWQAKVHRERRRFTIAVVARRCGKTQLALAELTYAALARPGCNVLYVGPYKAQSKAVFWERARAFLAPITAKVMDSEQRIQLINGSVFMVAGSGDGGDHLRGLSLTAVCLDEMSLMEDAVWHGALRPALADNRGEALFIGTPSGKDALFRLMKSTRNDPEWAHFVIPAEAAGVLPAEELESARRTLPSHVYQREFGCRFDVAMPGAVYEEPLARVDAEHRILPSIEVLPDLALQAALDLGIADATAVWLFQQLTSGEIRVLAFREVTNVSLHDVGLALRDQGVQRIIGPHDLRQRELSTARTRFALLEDLGFDVDVAPSLPVEEGIAIAGRTMARAYFDERHTSLGLDHLRAYRRSPETGRVLHDSSSHAADAWRYLALGAEPSEAVTRSALGAVYPVRQRYRVITNSRERR